MTTSVGMIGLGIMGGAMSTSLIAAGFEVVGCDIAADAVARFEAAGGDAVASPGEVAERAPVVILSLPTVAALDAVVAGLASAGRDGLIVVETGTFPIADKERAHDALAAAGTVLIDCPLSGTGHQARTGDLAVFASGDRDACETCVPVFDGFSRENTYVGVFGNGSRMKFVANHLINVHNVAAAEAMVLGMKSGLDPDLLYDVIRTSAATSRMFEIRGALMARDDYDEVGMKISVWQKDIRVITEFAEQVACPTPLFAAAAQPYRAAMTQGLADKDTAAVCRVLENELGIGRRK